MKNTQSGLATAALIIVVGLTLVAAGGYAFIKIRTSNRAADELISAAKQSVEMAARPPEVIAAELNAKRAMLRIEVNKLDLFRQRSFDPSSSFGQALAQIQRQVTDSVISSTESIFQAVVVAGIDPALKASVQEQRQEVVALLDAWQKTVAAAQAAPGTVSQATIANAANAALNAAEEYTQILVTATQNLTPENSNQTTTQIQTQQTVATNANNNATNASNNASTVQPDPEVVEDLEEEIDDLVEELEVAIVVTATSTTSTGSTGSTGGSTSTSTGSTGSTGGETGSNPGTPFVPPPPPSTSGQPQLIQGSNPL